MLPQARALRRRVSAVIALTLALAFAFVLKSGVSAHTAGEQIITSTFATSVIAAHHWNGTGFTADDLDPRTPGTTLTASLDLARELVATDRYLLSANLLTGLAVAVVDRATGVELPRPRTTLLSAVGLSASPDGRFAYLVGGAFNGTPTVSVIDLRPDSATFDTEVAAIPLLATSSAVGLTIDATGTRLFVLENVSLPAPTSAHIVTVDVTNPLAPAIIKNTTAAEPVANQLPGLEVTGNGRLHTFSSGGSDYLFVPRRQTQIYKILADGSLTYVQTLLLAQPQIVKDVVFVASPGGDRAYAITGRTATPFSVSVQTWDMTPSGPGFTGTLLGNAVIDSGATASGQEGSSQIASSFDGNRLYLTRIFGSSAPATLQAVDRAAVISSPATALIASTPLSALNGSNAVGLAVTSPFSPGASQPSVSSVAVDGVTNGVLVNSTSHTITVTGANLGAIHQAFLGLTRATVVSVSAASVTIASPALVPSNTAPLLLVGDDGNASGTVTIANAPDYFPSFVVYSSSTGTNQIDVLNAATGTSVTRAFDSANGPSDAAPTADGRFLVVGNFRGSGVTIHSLVDDPAHGFTADQRLADVPFGATVQRVVANPVRKRAYAASLGSDTIGVIDVDPDSPGFGTLISTFSSTAGGQVRSLAITPDGHYLFIGRINAPQILVADVSTDTVPAPTPITLASPASGNGRADGMAISPDGTRLYFMNSGDTFMRIFDITAPAAPVQIGTKPLPGAILGDIHRIQVLPNNRFLYVASRSKAAVDVFDIQANAFVATVPTGAFSNDPAVSKNSQYVFVGVAEHDAVLTIDAREMVNSLPNPNLHHIVAATGGGVGVTATSVVGGISTSAGSNIEVDPLPSVSVTFSTVTTPGLTTATSSNVSSVALPPFYFNPGLPVYVSVESSAVFTGGVTTCMTYDATGLTPAQEAAVRILHVEDGSYVDITTTTDAANNVVCGTSSDLGQFVVAFYDHDAPVITVPPNQTANASGVATFPAPTAFDALSGVASFSCDHASGETFPLGVTTVTCTAADNVGNTSTATFTVTNDRPPVCTAAHASVTSIWPANLQMVPVSIIGVTDPDGDATTIRITGILQDETVTGGGSGNTNVDGAGVGTSTAQVRAERAGTGNGRMYHILFTATDPSGLSCTGEVVTGVPHDQGKGRIVVDGGALYDSTHGGGLEPLEHAPTPVAFRED